MLVKRYVVKEMPEAVAMIRQDLGKDAVILSTKKIQSRGFLGLFSKTHIEVIAAANEQEVKVERPVERPIERPPVREIARQSALGAYQQVKTKLEEEPLQGAEDVIIPPVLKKETPVPPAGSPTVRISSNVSNETPSSHVLNQVSNSHVTSHISPNPVQPVVTPVAKAAPNQTHEDDQVLKEVQELRSLMRSFLSNSPKSILPQPLLQVRKELLENDLNDEVVDELMERGIRQFQQLDNVTEQEFRVILTNFIKEELDKEFQPLPLAPTTRVAAFIGPTGVGKTTTIAKLAAEQVLTRGKKVGLITTDTYRIAAVEQLRTYANILNVPLEVCYSQEDASRAMAKFADYDLVLVDSAGRNYNNEVNVNELNSYLQVLKPDETYLVLTLTTKASDLMQIVSNFDKVDIHKFLFTKADETRTYGAIYNLINRYKIPLSYMTTGQNVPDDIEIVSTGKLASLIVGEKSYV
jgi:flagellar biosynthesis protein FlhF